MMFSLAYNYHWLPNVIEELYIEDLEFWFYGLDTINKRMHNG